MGWPTSERHEVLLDQENRVFNVVVVFLKIEGNGSESTLQPSVKKKKHKTHLTSPILSSGLAHFWKTSDSTKLRKHRAFNDVLFSWREKRRGVSASVFCNKKKHIIEIIYLKALGMS